MDCKEDPDAGVHLHNMTTENSDTVAMQKKRARRVSFAEKTSIHLFNRDEEEDETPMLETDRISDDSPGEFGFGRLSKHRMRFADGDGDGDNHNDDDEDMRMTFLRPDGSPSPNGSTFDSASSNDEDNLFGPVSSNFIKPGRLSNSAASDDNHELTMDSTAFSMHYRSLARSESGVDLKTPTGGQLFFEEKTPTDASIGTSMAFTLERKPFLESSRPVTEISGSHNSNDMSLVGENPSKYDYEKLSPRLDALLAESRKDFLHDDTITSPSTKPNEAKDFSSIDHGDDPVNSSWIDSRDGKTAARIEVSGANDDALISASVSYMEKKSSNAAASNRDNDRTIKSPYQLSKVGQYGSESPLVSTFSPIKRQIITLTTMSPVKQRELMSPLTKSGSILRNGSVEHKKTETSIQKSISKLELLERSAFSSSFEAKTDNSFVRTLDFFKSPNFDPLLGNTRHISGINFEDSVNEEKFPSVCQSRETNYPSSSGCAGRTANLNHIGDENHVEKHLGQIVGGKLPDELKLGDISKDQTNFRETVSSPSKITWPGGNLEHSLFTSKYSNEDAVMIETESLLEEIASVNLPIETSNQDVEANSPTNLVEIQATKNGVDICNEKETFGTTNYVNSPAKEKRDHILNSKDQDVGNLTMRNLSRFENDLPGRGPMLGFNDSVLPSTGGDLDESRFQKKQLDSRTTSSRKELDTEQIAGTHSPQTTKLSDMLEKFEGGKRHMELLLRGTQHRDEMASIQRSPKVQKLVNSFSKKMVNLNEGRTELIVHEKKKWTDTYSKFTEDMKNLFSESADKLNTEMIDALEGSLVYQQRSKVYEMLRDDIFHENSTVRHDLQHEKITETNSLLNRVVFENAKLQLNHVKKERLLKRLQLLSSRLQESQQLRENIALKPLQTCVSAVVDTDGDQTGNLKKGHEICQEKLIAMRQTLDTLDKKILNLTKTFHARCKIKAESGCVDTISLVNKHLTERATHRLIRLEMQMYVVQSVSSVNGHHNVVLNYLGFITQSIKILADPASSVSTSFELNETNIIKNFPNMDACIAFAYVFNAETSHKYIRSKTLPQETQVTSSLLGTLLDVVNEVQSAQIEFPNLTQSSFCSPSAEQLHLRLCFFNFVSGQKVNLILDISCLKRGIYPSEIVPLQLFWAGDSGNALSSKPKLDEINEAVKDVKTGYMRILCLCKCVSQVVGAPTV